MTKNARFEELLAELRSALSVEDDALLGEPGHLGEVVGVIAASADADSLRDATTTAQVRLRRTESTEVATYLTLVREVLRAAGLVRAGEVVSEVEQEIALSVRERVLVLLRELTEARSSDIAATLSIGLPQVSRALTELASAGLAVRADARGLDGRARYWRPAAVGVDTNAPFAAAISWLGRAEADRGGFRNDLLPLGPADRADADAVDAMTGRLQNSLAAGRYKPAAAVLFRVSKDGDTTRPGALLRLPDRIVFTALVRSIAEAIEQSLSSSVLWPRASYGQSQWDDFERAPIESGSEFVVVADVASFYDTVDHNLLADSLREFGADPGAVSAVGAFLGAVMQRSTGLPQGLPASDPLATAALARVDAALTRAGIQFARHGDDFRISAEHRFAAREAIAVLDDALRSQRLHLNSAKTHAVPVEAYEANLREREAHRSGVIRTIRQIMGFPSGDGALGEAEGFNAINDPGLDRLGRLAGIGGARAFRSAFMPRSEVDYSIRVGRYGEVEGFGFVEPDIADVERHKAFESLMSQAEATGLAAAERLLTPRQDRWRENADRQSLTSMLSILSAGARPVADAEWWSNYLLSRPQDSRTVARYLAHLADSDLAEMPAKIARDSLERQFSDWQRAWLLSALAWGEVDVARSFHKQLFACLDGGAGWLSRLGASWLLQRSGLLSPTQAYGLWTAAPAALRSDLLVMLSHVERTADVERALRNDVDDVERALIPAVA